MADPAPTPEEQAAAADEAAPQPRKGQPATVRDKVQFDTKSEGAGTDPNTRYSIAEDPDGKKNAAAAKKKGGK